MLEALEDSNRGFDAVVVGEPQRVFYDNQFGLIFPLFVHFQVGLWVPEVGGTLDPDSEAHCLIMSMYAGMSKAERRRIQVRVPDGVAAAGYGMMRRLLMRHPTLQKRGLA